MANKRESVKVIVRCRPLSEKETIAGNLPVIDVDSKIRKIRIHAENVAGEKEFTFDATYGFKSSQEDLFNESVRPLVQAVLEGFNGTIFAYGQTGTGKTFTMQGTKDNPGIIPRAMEEIFRHIEESSNEHYLVNASYLELYQEEIRDLLWSKEKNEPEKKIEIKEKPNGDIYLKHLSAYQLKSLRHMEKMMERGQKNRSVGSTDMNEQSSRSHAIFIVSIECGQIGPDGKEHIRVGKLNLVDLAGSEKQSKTHSTGDRFKEATQINLSLSTLGMVITALVDKASHVPYRDSKLTRLLQDSLGGNSKTIMLANIGPANYNLEETISTLRYANRAKNIKNSPHINEDPKDAKMREYLDELTALKAKLASRSSDVDKSKKSRLEKDNSVEEQDDSEEERLAEELAKIARERTLIMDNNNLNDEDKDSLLAEFAAKEQVLQKQESERQELKAKVEAIEHRMLRGVSYGKDVSVQERMNLQQASLQEHKRQLEEQKKREAEMLEALNREQQDAQETNATVSVVRADIDNIHARIVKLQRQLHLLQSEMEREESIAQEFNQQLNDDLEEQRQEETLMWTMISHFVSPALWEPLIQSAYYDEKSSDWILASETSEVVRPPLFVDIPLYRLQDIREQYAPVLTENVIDVIVDTSDDICREHIESTPKMMEESELTDLLSEALDSAAAEEDLIIDADIFTIERPRSGPLSDNGDVEKENQLRRGRNTSTGKPFRASPDLVFPASRGWIK